MKKTLALILAIVCVGLMVCGCGNKAENGSAATDSSIGKASDGGESTPSSQAADNKDFENLKLSDEQYIMGSDEEDVCLRFPSDWFVADLVGGYMAGEGTEDSVDKKSYAIFAGVIVDPEKTFSKTTIDNCFSSVYVCLPDVFSQYNNGVYDEYTPNIIDRVNLSYGPEAIVFEGNQPATFNGEGTDETKTECYVRGYSFLINNSAVIIGYIVFDNDTVDDTKDVELQHYIEKMVQAVETQPC